MNFMNFMNFVKGDIFKTRLQTITIPVNTVGVMDKGIALRAKQEYPDVFEVYQQLCQSHTLKMGSPCLYQRNPLPYFLLFPTKRHWKEMSDLLEIEKGLQWLVDNYEKEGIESIAMPALGCGLGGLSWETVEPILRKYLCQMNIPIDIYVPIENVLNSLIPNLKIYFNI